MSAEKNPSTTFAEQASYATFAEEVLPRHEQSAVFAELGQGLPAEYTPAYNHWRRGADERAQEKIAAKVDLLGQFATFEAGVDSLLTGLQAGEPATQLGAGGKSYVHEVTVDGRSYAVRLVAPPASMEVPASQVNRYATNMYRARGRLHTEQLAAIFFTRPITVSETAPGKNSTISLTGAGLQQVTHRHLAELVAELKGLHFDNMGIDQNPENVLHHAERGFTCIDLGRPLFRDVEKTVGYALSFLFGQTLPNAPASDYDGRAILIEDLRGIVRSQFTRAEAAAIDEILVTSQRALRETGIDKLRGRDISGSFVHYYAGARAEAQQQFSGDRPSQQAWLDRYAPKSTTSTPNSTSAVHHPGVLNTPVEGGLLAEVRSELERARLVITEASSMLDVTTLAAAIDNINRAIEGSNNQTILEAVEQLETARLHAARALVALQTADAKTVAYLRDIGI